MIDTLDRIVCVCMCLDIYIYKYLNDYIRIVSFTQQMGYHASLDKQIGTEWGATWCNHQADGHAGDSLPQ